MKNSTKILLLALAAIVLVSTVAVLIPRAARAHEGESTLVIADGYPRYPWVFSCQPNASGLNTVECGTNAPAGAALVIQNVSISAILSAPGAPVFIQVSTTVNGSPNVYNTTATPPATLVQLWASTPLTIYADPKASINILAVVPSSTFATSSDVAIFLEGYYVKLR
jgi:hypothetical protein